ncbi:MAG: glycosyltransferase family 2 protein [Taibaiella sp.]|nr:glycosyltransferase family 2 protein [Taibaiella sp.]
MSINNLWVVMPVYNEEEAITSVCEEWYRALEATGLNYTLCILNDGSKDGTLKILNEFAAKYRRLKIIDKANSGHGQSCVLGYNIALENGADWILQIDSDGQCDPQYFPAFVQLAATRKAIYGFRKTRDDGFKRYLISRFVTLFTFAATGQWVKDANVPYRLIHESVMRNISNKIPAHFHLANIYVSVLSNKLAGIKWVDIHFRDRSGGSPSVKTFSFIKHGFTLFRQLKEASRANVS